MSGAPRPPAPGWRRLFRLPRFSRRFLEQEVDDELAFHLEMRAAKLRGEGYDATDARADALRRFGDATRIRQQCLEIDHQYAREVTFMEWLESVTSDVHYALRTLRRSPVFAIVVCLTLAIGIGASSAMFSLVDGVLLRPLPYANPERLVQLRQSYPEKGLDDWTLSQQNLAIYRDQVADFASTAGYARRGVTLDGMGPPERLNVAFVTGDFFTVLGVPPVAGHAFGRDDDRPHQSLVTVLSYGFWQSRFAGRAGAVGSTIDLGGTPVRIVGVMPADFRFPSPDVQLYLPLGLDPARRNGWFITGIARLRPGATVTHAAQQATQTMWRWARDNPDLMGATPIRPENTRMRALVTPLRTAITGSVARPLALLQTAVLLLLLIGVANIATLISSRSAARGAELAVRTALGASGPRVARQLVTESLVLATIGGALGVLVALGVVRAFIHWNGGALPRLDEVSVNGHVLVFALAVSVLSGVLFGLAPAVRTVRLRRFAGDLAGTQKSSAGRGTRRFNNSLITLQLALSMILLVSAGLVLKSFRRLMAADLGFEPVGITSVSIALPTPDSAALARVPLTTQQIVDRIAALPGVRGVSATWYLPFSGAVNTDGFLVEGHAPPANAGAETQTIQMPVTPGFFPLMHIPLRYGRDFTSADRANTLPVVIVDDAFAKRYWSGADAIGKRMRFSGDTTWRTIVGVVGSVRDEDVATEGRPHSYQPFDQAPGSRPVFAIRIAGDPAPILVDVRRVIAEIAPTAPIAGVRPLTDAISQTLESRRLTEMLLAGFALVAALLTAVGIYGVMTLYVTNRTREFGVRLAVGAQPATIVRLVLREGVVLAVVGVAIGAFAGLVVTRWLRGQLYEVSPTDGPVFALIGIALLSVAVLACIRPARVAARTDALAALRSE